MYFLQKSKNLPVYEAHRSLDAFVTSKSDIEKETNVQPNETFRAQNKDIYEDI